jgi:hypothetical protein
MAEREGIRIFLHARCGAKGDETGLGTRRGARQSRGAQAKKFCCEFLTQDTSLNFHGPEYA